MVSESRSVRIAERIKVELSLLFLQEINDPRLDGVNITSVNLDREISFADIYISADPSLHQVFLIYDHFPR